MIYNGPLIEAISTTSQPYVPWYFHALGYRKAQYTSEFSLVRNRMGMLISKFKEIYMRRPPAQGQKNNTKYQMTIRLLYLKDSIKWQLDYYDNLFCFDIKI